MPSLRLAAEELGLELAVGVREYRWFGELMGDSPLPLGMKPEDCGKCDHVLRIPGNAEAYEIGVVKNADGTFSMRWDFYDGGYGLQDRVGENAGKLVQAYAVQVAMKAARLQGFAVQRKLLADGRVQLQCHR